MRSRYFSSRPLLLLLIGLLLPISPSTAEINAPGKIPMQPIPVKVQVERGKTVEIPFRVYGGGHRSVTYRIRSAPQFGLLINPRMIDENDGLVTYQHSGDFGHNTDTFHFAAKSIGGISAQVAVKITITDRRPKLVAPAHAEFGEILIGTGAAMRVSITNEGGGIDRGVVTATTPWHIAGDPSYSLGPGENAIFTIVCDPLGDGELRGTLQFSSSPTSSTRLHAIAVPPFRIDPPVVTLTLVRNSRIRFGTFRIENTADLDQTIEISGGYSLGLPEKISLPAGADPAEVRIRTESENLAAIDTLITLTGTNYRTQIRARASTIPAIVEVDKATVDFGEVPLRQTSKKFFLVSNRGGEKAFLDLTVPSPFSVLNDAVEFSLAPGETHNIGVSVRPESWGITSGEMIVKGFQAEIPIRLVSRTTRPFAVERRSDAKTNSSTRERQMLNEAFPLLDEARLENVTHTTATIAWPTAESVGTRYRLEARILTVAKDTGNVEIRWIPFSNVLLERSGDESRATATELTPGGGYNVRVVEVDEFGQILRASRTLQVIPSPEKRFALAPAKALFSILIIVSALLARQKIQKRRKACCQLVGAT